MISGVKVLIKLEGSFLVLEALEIVIFCPFFIYKVPLFEPPKSPSNFLNGSGFSDCQTVSESPEAWDFRLGMESKYSS